MNRVPSSSLKSLLSIGFDITKFNYLYFDTLLKKVVNLSSLSRGFYTLYNHISTGFEITRFKYTYIWIPLSKMLPIFNFITPPPLPLEILYAVLNRIKIRFEIRRSNYLYFNIVDKNTENFVRCSPPSKFFFCNLKSNKKLRVKNK